MIKFLGVLISSDFISLFNLSLFFVTFLFIFLLFSHNFNLLGFEEMGDSSFFSLFYFLIIFNVGGLTPYFMSGSLWPSILIFLSMWFWFSGIFNLFSISWMGLFQHFSMLNLNIFMCSFLVFVELVSVMIRIITLSFRLFANILGGHLMLEVLASFKISNIIMMMFFSYELFVALIQALIFSMLVFFYKQESSDLV